MSGPGGVVVAGGGVGGLALGTGLHRAGVPVTVVEPRVAVDEGGAGLVLYPNAVTALRSIDPALADAVAAAGHVAAPGQVRPLVDAAGTVLSVDDVGGLAARYGAPQVSLMRSALLRVLTGYARRAGVALRTGRRVVDHVDDGDAVRVTLDDGAVLHAAALVGADGIRSGVRERLLGDGAPAYCGYTTVRGLSGPSAAHPYGVVVTDGERGMFAAPVAGGDLYWTVKVAAPAGTWPAKGARRAAADLASEIAGWHPSLAGIVRGGSGGPPPVVTDVCSRPPATRWGTGRVTLLGDAAHPMSPGMGQGAGMALEDAAVLTRRAAGLADPGEALAGYAADRAPRAAWVVAASNARDTVTAREGTTEFTTTDDRLAALFGWAA